MRRHRFITEFASQFEMGHSGSEGLSEGLVGEIPCQLDTVSGHGAQSISMSTGASTRTSTKAGTSASTSTVQVLYKYVAHAACAAYAAYPRSRRTPLFLVAFVVLFFCIFPLLADRLPCNCEK